MANGVHRPQFIVSVSSIFSQCFINVVLVRLMVRNSPQSTLVFAADFQILISNFCGAFTMLIYTMAYLGVLQDGEDVYSCTAQIGLYEQKAWFMSALICYCADKKFAQKTMAAGACLCLDFIIWVRLLY